MFQTKTTKSSLIIVTDQEPRRQALRDMVQRVCCDYETSLIEAGALSAAEFVFGTNLASADRIVLIAELQGIFASLLDPSGKS